MTFRKKRSKLQFDSFIPCSERIVRAVTDMVLLFPEVSSIFFQSKSKEPTTHVAISGAGPFCGICKPLLSHRGSNSLRDWVQDAHSEVPTCPRSDHDDVDVGNHRDFWIFIGPESDHWECLSVTDSLTHWLTHSCLVNLIDVTLACEDGNSKLVEVVTVADVDAEDHVGNSLLQIWEVTFGPKAKLLFRLWAQGLVKILKLKFRQDFEAGVCSAFCRWCFVEVMKLNLGRDSEARFGQDFEF